MIDDGGSAALLFGSLMRVRHRMASVLANPTPSPGPSDAAGSRLPMIESSAVTVAGARYPDRAAAIAEHRTPRADCSRWGRVRAAPGNGVGVAHAKPTSRAPAVSPARSRARAKPIWCRPAPARITSTRRQVKPRFARRRRDVDPSVCSLRAPPGQPSDGTQASRSPENRSRCPPAPPASASTRSPRLPPPASTFPIIH